MESILTEDRATIIANAIRNDNFQIGSEPWLTEHHITLDEYHAFLDAPAEYARMAEFKRMNPDVGAVEVEMSLTTHSGKVGSPDEKWTVMVPQKFTNAILRVAEHGPVMATLVPMQLSFAIDGEYASVDTLTGELVM